MWGTCFVFYNTIIVSLYNFCIRIAFYILKGILHTISNYTSQQTYEKAIVPMYR